MAAVFDGQKTEVDVKLENVVNCGKCQEVIFFLSKFKQNKKQAIFAKVEIKI